MPVKTSRSLFSYSKIQHLVGLLIRNNKFQSGFQAIRFKRYLDIGCGWKTHVHMINLDWQWHPKIDICWDVAKKGLPIPRSSLDGIYSEHCLEHHHPSTIFYLLSECYRVLRPGGKLRLVLPDAQKYISTYYTLLHGDKAISYPYPEDISLHGIQSPLLGVNRIFYQDRESPHGHCFMFDELLLRAFLIKTGFVNIVACDFRSGSDPQLLLDSSERWIESFAMEAQRPHD